MRLITTNRTLIGQAAKFALVGLLNTAVDAAVYYLLTRYVGFFASRQAWAKAVSYCAGVVNSFLWNRAWTFRSSANWRAFIPFFAVSLVGAAINAGVMHLGLNALRLPEAISFLLATGITLIWNFSVSKLLIFRK
jgi:putative flippase GtrA